MDATPEEWRPVVGLEGSYEVSNRGKVRSLDRVIEDRRGVRRRVSGRTLKPGTNQGYFCVSLAGHTRSVHQLVLEAFVGPYPSKTHEVCHNNGDKTDNRLENLRYGTRSENTLDMVRHGMHPMARKTHCKRGHEYTPDNTGYTQTGRYCRQCSIIKGKKRYASLDRVVENARRAERDRRLTAKRRAEKMRIQ